MEQLKDIRKKQKKAQREFLMQPFAPKVFIFELDNLKNVPSIKEAQFSTIY